MRLASKLALTAFGFFAVFGVVAATSSFALLVGSVVAGAGCALFIYFKLEPLSEVVDAVDEISQGEFRRGMLAEEGDPEIQRLAAAANRIRIQYEDSLETATNLAAGKIGIAEIEERVLRTGALSDADDTEAKPDGPLEEAMIELGNQMRRLTIQARIISHDRLSSPLLEERVPGELGDAFALMVRKLRALKDRARQIADGDLTGRVEGEGDLTEAFNKMAARFERLASEITLTGVHISTSAEEILSVLREQQLSATHQASGVEETQKTMETLLSSARRIAESAQTVFKSAEKTQANNRIVGERISELKGHTERIGEILEVIKSIADRSDLLALNASLEGMRAGEAGKGFTLVAGEMRRLAESIKESVADIKDLLGDIRESALSSVMATEEGSNLSEKTTESALKITLITQQQQSGTEQVTSSMDELSALINQGVAGMQQVTVAADELVEMSDDLRGIVGDFETGGSSSPSSSAEVPVVRPGPRRRRRAKQSDATDSMERLRARREESSVAQEAHSEVSDVIEEFTRDSEAGETKNAKRSSGRRNTLAMTPVADPPTVELTAMSADEERELLANAFSLAGDEQISVEDLIEKFRGVALDRVEKMSVLLVEVENDADPEKVETLTREIHTLKGEAKMMGFADVNLVGHLVEHILLDAAERSFKVPAEITNLILEGLDVLGALLTKSPAGMSAPIDLAGFVDRVAVARGAGALEVGEVDSDTGSVALESHDPVQRASIAEGSLLRIKTSGTMRVDLSKLERLAENSGEVLLAGRRLTYQLDELELFRRRFNALRSEMEALLPKSLAARSRSIGVELESLVGDVRGQLGEVEQWAGQLDGQIRDLRHTPLESALQHYPRAVRDLASSRGKEVKLERDILGVEVDQAVLNALAEPLLHLVRNAVDHGIESPAERVEAGKPEEGVIRIEARYAGDSVRVVLSDDGRGMDPEALRERAVSRGFIGESEAALFSREDCLAMIFEPGFTTRDDVTDVSGRGIGMDVVRRQVYDIGGTVEIDSEVGVGTTFTLVLPVSSAVGSILTFVLDDRMYGLSSVDIERVILADRTEIVTGEHAVEVMWEDDPIPLLDWRLTLDDFSRELPRGTLTLVLLRRGRRRAAIWVDDVVGERDAMTRPLGDFLVGLPLCRGVALTDAGEVLPLLNVAELLEPDRRMSPGGAARSPIRATMELPRIRKNPKILVVEDSEITRTLVSNILRNAGYDVQEAEDGWIGWQKVRDGRYDLVVTDVQMPRMSGLDLLDHIRGEANLRSLPVVMLTTLGDAADKSRAMQKGASGYIVKLSFQESDLLEMVRRFLG